MSNFHLSKYEKIFRPYFEIISEVAYEISVITYPSHMRHKFSHQLEKNSSTIEVWLSETVYPELALIVFQIAAANVALATFAFKELHEQCQMYSFCHCSSVVLNIVFSVFSLV